MSGINSLNTTFLATTIGLTYLCMDPVVKAAYILRCYYGEALKSGTDIKNQLNRLVRQGKSLVTVLFLILVLSPSAVFATAQREVTTGAVETGANTISAEDLDHSIEQVLSQREFAWRLPRERMTEEDPEKSGPVATAVKWIWRMLGKGLKTLWRWVEKLFEWLVDLLPKSDPDKNASDTGWQISVRGLLIVLLVLAAGVSIYLFWRIWQRRRIKPAPVESEAVSVAMRALYLATLAHLAEHDLINIEAYKSNLDYKHELQRRAHGNPELLTAFSTVVTLLERVWFGMHKISQQEVDTFTKNQKRIMTFAEE
jgi:hypothetical protein